MKKTELTDKDDFIVALNWVDCITLTGFFLSGVAIYYAINTAIPLALSCLLLAVLADAFDGVLARKFATERSFGRYLDSFVDCNIYLLTPCVIFYNLGFVEWYYCLSMLIFGMSGIVRLAVFNVIGNVSKNQESFYLGLPVFWMAFVVAGYYFLSSFVPMVIAEVCLSIWLLGYSYFMLKNIEFYKPQNKWLMLIVTLGLSGFFLAWSFLAG